MNGVRDSWFVDSPLSALGLEQANALRTHLAEDKSEDTYRQIMTGNQRPSIIVCSNLRRCISTACVAFSDRLRRTEESIKILPCLQEISTNPDTISITPPHTAPQPSWLEKGLSEYDLERFYAKHIDTTENTGNKRLDSNGLERMMAFCEWAFTSDVNVDTLIVSGHSLWFRNFFREFLPRKSTHDAKNQKIVNGGAVGFELECRTLDSGNKAYRISPDSIKVVYGGFKAGH